MNTQKIITLIVAVVVIGGGVFLFLKKDELPSVGTALLGDKNEVSEEEIRGGTIEKADEKDKEVYSNTTYGFSFTYPEGFQIGSFQEGTDGEVILIQSPEGREGFQIYVAPFDESGPITPERIKRDLPSLKIDEPQRVVIGGGGLEALIFRGESEEFGESREVWFVWSGNLYQVTTHADLDQFIGPILESWRFET